MQLYSEFGYKYRVKCCYVLDVYYGWAVTKKRIGKHGTFGVSLQFKSVRLFWTRRCLFIQFIEIFAYCFSAAFLIILKF